MPMQPIASTPAPPVPAPLVAPVAPMQSAWVAALNGAQVQSIRDGHDPFAVRRGLQGESTSSAADPASRPRDGSRIVDLLEASPSRPPFAFQRCVQPGLLRTTRHDELDPNHRAVPRAPNSRCLHRSPREKCFSQSATLIAVGLTGRLASVGSMTNT